MCGRFAIGDTDGDDWAEWLAAEPTPDWPTARWNIAPTQRIGIIGLREGKRAAATARWGLIPRWWKKPLAEFKLTTFNARSEEAAEKPLFRDAWRRYRCLVPAIGWYEWKGPKGDKTPYFITIRRNTPGFYFAGLWSETEIEGERIRSATIMTAAAGAATREIHHRTPVVLDEEEAGRWLDLSADPADCMHAPADDRVELWEVGRAVGKVANDGPELIEKAG